MFQKSDPNEKILLFLFRFYSDLNPNEDLVFFATIILIDNLLIKFFIYLAFIFFSVKIFNLLMSLVELSSTDDL